MSSTIFPAGGSTFRFIRPTLIANGRSADLDSYVQKQISLLSLKLSLKFIESKRGGAGIPLKDFFAPKEFEAQLAKIAENAGALTLDEVIDDKGEASLYYKVQEMIKENRLPLNTTRILQNKGISAYLFARAKYHHDLDDKASIYKFMTNDEDGGIRIIYNYLVKESAKALITKEKLELGTNPVTKKDYTTDEFVNLLGLEKSNILFSKDAFSAKQRAIITNRIFNGDQLDIINKLKLKLKIDDADIPALVNYMKNSKIEIDKDNAEFYLPIALSEIKNNTVSFSTAATATDETDFAVQYYDDDKTTLEVSKESVLCAAMMYYNMTLGDELDIFNTVNTIVTKYLPSGQVDITSKETLNDLQMYVFNDSFKDFKDGTIYRRTQPEERRMFYRQLFSAGNAEVVEGMALNPDFNVLWATLMEETVKHIDKLERSENPEMFVSRQPIFQAIEDLQYNLSTHCTGLVKVAAPVINKELDFVVQRILMNEEIRRQLAPNGNASFWKVVENVQRGSRNEVPNVAALRNKAVFGHKILTVIANYTPDLLDNDIEFGKFISTVEAFIIANSQLEGSQETDTWKDETDQKEEKTPSSVNGSSDEWDF